MVVTRPGGFGLARPRGGPARFGFGLCRARPRPGLAGRASARPILAQTLSRFGLGLGFARPGPDLARFGLGLGMGKPGLAGEHLLCFDGPAGRWTTPKMTHTHKGTTMQSFLPFGVFYVVLAATSGVDILVKDSCQILPGE